MINEIPENVKGQEQFWLLLVNTQFPSFLAPVLQTNFKCRKVSLELFHTTSQSLSAKNRGQVFPSISSPLAKRVNSKFQSNSCFYHFLSLSIQNESRSG